ncbi:hypothetical protein EON82_04355 [bacterium]|nr:MAG: hypothetical protein EON82_04355 [bacterium]
MKITILFAIGALATISSAVTLTHDASLFPRGVGRGGETGDVNTLGPTPRNVRYDGPFANRTFTQGYENGPFGATSLLDTYFGSFAPGQIVNYFETSGSVAPFFSITGGSSSNKTDVYDSNGGYLGYEFDNYVPVTDRMGAQIQPGIGAYDIFVRVHGFRNNSFFVQELTSARTWTDVADGSAAFFGLIAEMNESIFQFSVYARRADEPVFSPADLAFRNLRLGEIDIHQDHRFVPAAVPEPGSLVAFAPALLLVRRRRRNLGSSTKGL